MFDAAMSRGAAGARLRAALAAAGLPSPGLDARLLLAAALGIEPIGVVTSAETPLGAAGAERLAALARRRLFREPVARILGEREFWGLAFRLSAGTLEPRPDSETVVEAALSRLPDREAPHRLLDLGTGSGCLLVALLVELPGAIGLGVDRSRDALATARANADANGVGPRALFAASDWGAALGTRFDVVVANPPYIPDADIAQLEPEVACYDPAAALAGGPDGLAAYRAILVDLPRLLAPAGLALLEVGHDQSRAVQALARAHGLVPGPSVRDLGGRDRVVTLWAEARSEMGVTEHPHPSSGGSGKIACCPGPEELA